jgi:hypothetical protein
MSYRFTFYFKNDIKDLKDFLEFQEKVTNSFSLNNFIKLLDTWIIDKAFLVKKGKLPLNRFYSELYLKCQSISMSFYFWPEYDLVGTILNYGSNKDIENLYDCSFYFQDSSDEDYPYSSYEGLPEKMLKHFEKEDDYNTASGRYHQLCEKLKINEILYDKDNQPIHIQLKVIKDRKQDVAVMKMCSCIESHLRHTLEDDKGVFEKMSNYLETTNWDKLNQSLMKTKEK